MVVNVKYGLFLSGRHLLLFEERLKVSLRLLEVDQTSIIFADSWRSRVRGTLRGSALRTLSWGRIRCHKRILTLGCFRPSRCRIRGQNNKVLKLVFLIFLARSWSCGTGRGIFIQNGWPLQHVAFIVYEICVLPYIFAHWGVRLLLNIHEIIH